MSNKTKRVALLIHCSDRYELLFRGFHYFFSKYWDYSIPCTYYFATEEKDIPFPEFKNIKSGKGEWSTRLKILLEEKIEEEYILYFQEDMWLNKKVNAAFFEELFNLTIKNKWNQVKLHSSGVYKTIETRYFIEGFNVAEVDNKNSKFLMSHQVTLWQKGYLLTQLLENESPWLNETLATKRLKELNPEIIHIDYFAENGGSEINKNKNPIGRSEYQAISVNSCFYHTIRPYIQELMQGDKERKKYARKLRHHYIFQITHDGSARPRKESMFMDFKIWLKGLRPRLSYALSGILK